MALVVLEQRALEGRVHVRRVEALSLCELLAAVRALDRQADLALCTVGVEHLDLHSLARRQHRARILDVLVADLADVDETLDALLQLHEGAEVENLEDLA